MARETSVKCSTEGKGLFLYDSKKSSAGPQLHNKPQVQYRLANGSKGCLPQAQETSSSTHSFSTPTLIPQPSGINASWNIKCFYKKEKNNPDIADKKFWWKN